jgi:hypothetical protein
LPGKESAVSGSFAPETLRLIDEAKEVHIETRRDEDAPVHRTTIWLVTVGSTVFVRSVRGEEGRWYREVSANPAAALHVGGFDPGDAAARDPAYHPEARARLREDLDRRRWVIETREKSD